MKKLFLFLMLASVMAFAINPTTYGQKNVVKTTVCDSLLGAESVDFASVELNNNYASLALTALFTNLGGTTDGTLWFEGSTDGTNFFPLADIANRDWYDVIASDTTKIATNGYVVTMTDGESLTLIVRGGTPLKEFRSSGTGTSGDSTIITQTYLLRK